MNNNTSAYANAKNTTTEMMIFKNKELGQITAIEKNGKPWFIGKEIARILGYSDTDQAIRTHCKYQELFKPVDLPGLKCGPRGMFFIPEKDLYRLIMRSELPNAEKFQDWVTDEVLPSIRKTGTYNFNQNESPDYAQTKAHLDLELFALENLNGSDFSKLMITYSVYEDHGVPTKYLPHYVEKVKVTFSAKDLLDDNDCSISTIAFNKLMIAAGYMEVKKRTASKGKVKTFKSLVGVGLKYGQNDASKQNPRETQPHYFEDNFMELFGLVNL